MIYSDEEIIPLNLTFNDISLPVYTFDTVVIGAGTAGLNAADCLFELGQTNIAIITDGMRSGISKNCFQNSQVISKNTSSRIIENAYDTAMNIYERGSADGDIALICSVMQQRVFYKLADAGMDFPQNDYGEFYEYTDGKKIHNLASCGYDTAKKITECLEKKIQQKHIPIFNRFRVLTIITDTDDSGGKSSVGLLAIDCDMQKSYQNDMGEYLKYTRIVNANKTIFGKIHEKININSTNSKLKKTYGQNLRNDPSFDQPIEEVKKPDGNKYGLTLIRTANIIYSAGGAGSIYENDKTFAPENTIPSVSPVVLAGAKLKNLCETSFGIALKGEVKWKFSDILFDIMPCFYSTGKDIDDKKEFLTDYINDFKEYAEKMRLKSENWQFDYGKLKNDGSSVIDFAVLYELYLGRNIFVSFRDNPLQIKNDPEDNIYKTSTPFERLNEKNQDLIKILKGFDIDIESGDIEITITAEHQNGGIAHDIFFESNIKHFFPVGEAAATFGVFCPPGVSLSATQISSMRAAQKISKEYKNAKVLDLSDFWIVASEYVYKYIIMAGRLLKNAVKNVTSENIFVSRKKYQKQFSAVSMIIRPLNDVILALADCMMSLAEFYDDNKVDDISYLNEAFLNYDILIAQLMYLSSIKNYITDGGRSRGNYIITENLDDIFKIYERDKNFDALENIKYKYTQKKKIVGNLITKNIEEEIDGEKDYSKLAAYIKFFDPDKFVIEYETNEVCHIPEN